MTKQPKDISVTELFKQFCKERHAEDKGRNHDMLQEIYAKTELFDLSLLPKTAPDTTSFWNGKSTYNEADTVKEAHFVIDSFKGISLPFESQFVKLGRAGEENNVLLFVREYSPNLLTGTVYITFDKGALNSPFSIDTNTGKLDISIEGFYDYRLLLKYNKLSENDKDTMLTYLLNGTLHSIPYALNAICNLPKHSVACDTPKKAEYFTRKHSSTIKVIKPVYYVLDKKEEKNPVQFKRINPLGHCCFDHSFKVRSHWRRINENSLGVDRYGVRRIKGMTFIKEYVKGEGDLVKKIRIVK